MLETHSESDRPVRQTPAAAPVTRRRRPFGVNVIVVLLLLDFAASALAGILVPFGWSEVPRELRFEAAVDIAFAVVQGLASLVVAFGLLRLRHWAWYGVMILTGMSLLVAIWQYFRGFQPYIELLLNSLIAFYLNQREVQRLFVAAPGDPAP